MATMATVMAKNIIADEFTAFQGFDGAIITGLDTPVKKSNPHGTRKLLTVNLTIENSNVQNIDGPYRVSRVIEVIWRPPPPYWIKVNTDGSTYGSPGQSGCGGVYRTCTGSTIACFAVQLGVCCSFEAELAAAIYAIECAWRLNWKRLWLESDCTYVVSRLTRRSHNVPRRWRLAWDRCLDHIRQMEFVASHIYREGNKAADALAAVSHKVASKAWWWKHPDFISQFIFDDINCKPSYRYH